MPQREAGGWPQGEAVALRYRTFDYPSFTSSPSLSGTVLAPGPSRLGWQERTFPPGGDCWLLCLPGRSTNTQTACLLSDVFRYIFFLCVGTCFSRAVLGLIVAQVNISLSHHELNVSVRILRFSGVSYLTEDILLYPHTPLRRGIAGAPRRTVQATSHVLDFFFSLPIYGK